MVIWCGSFGSVGGFIGGLIDHGLVILLCNIYARGIKVISALKSGNRSLNTSFMIGWHEFFSDNIRSFQEEVVCKTA